MKAFVYGSATSSCIHPQVEFTFFPQGQGSKEQIMPSEPDMLIPAQYAAKVVQMLLIHLKGKLDPIMPAIIQLIFKKLARVLTLKSEIERRQEEDKEFYIENANGTVSTNNRALRVGKTICSP